MRDFSVGGTSSGCFAIEAQSAIPCFHTSVVSGNLPDSTCSRISEAVNGPSPLASTATCH